MTSVPKPLKFLRPKFEVLKGYYKGELAEVGEESMTKDSDLLFLRARLGDVLAMALGKHGECGL